MAENLTEMMQREWSLANNEKNNYHGKLNNNHSWHSRRFTRKISDQSSGNNHHHHQHPLTNDYNDISSSSSIPPARLSKFFSNRTNSDGAYDTDGAFESSRNSLRHHHHHHSSNNYDYLVSPRLPVRHQMTQPPKSMINGLSQHRSIRKAQFNSNSPLPSIPDHDDRDDDSNDDSDARRRHIRLSRRTHRPSTIGGIHDVRLNRTITPSQHAAPVLKPLRIIFMRHSERANQALGPDWFNKAFRTNSYVAYDENLPRMLPKRRFDEAFAFDAPLTVNGLNIARLTGRAMLSNGLIPDACLSSTALRCVQTCERILTGMDRRNRIPIRIEPGLFECPHLNHNITDSFMSKRELMENSYNIKHGYKALVPKVPVPETLDDYFDRSAAVIHGIIDRYGHRGGTVLIVTHAPGLLALTDALKGLRPNIETFYRTVSTYPPLATYLAEYDGTKWRFSDQPFNIISTEQ